MDKHIDFNVNSCFREVYETNCRIIDIHGGRGRGGSHFVTDYFLYKLTQPKYFRGYFIRRIKADIKQSLFQDIKDRIEEHPQLTMEDFVFNETNYTVRCKTTGNMIYSRGTEGNKSRKANMKSIAGATAVAFEEFEEIDEDDYDQLNVSLRTTKSRIEIFRIYNQPPVGHWLYRDYNLVEHTINIDGEDQLWYFPEVKKNHNILSIHTTFRHNIKNLNDTTVNELLRFKETRPEYYWNQIEGYINAGLKGQIYSGWKYCTTDQYNAIDETPIYGLDFGYSSHPTALVGVKRHYDTRYCKELIFESGLDNRELAKRLLSFGITDADIIIADPGAGGDLRIAELRNGIIIDGTTYYFNIYAATKNPGSVLYGINKIKGLHVVVTEDSNNMWYEYSKYKWILDANKKPTDRPNKAEDVDNTLDAFRYTEITNF